MGQGEDDLVVAHRQELVLARLDPALLGQGLTLGAVAVVAGVVVYSFPAVAARWDPAGAAAALAVGPDAL